MGNQLNLQLFYKSKNRKQSDTISKTKITKK